MASFDEMAQRLREWPRGFVPDVQPLVREVLSACTSIYQGAGAVLAWEDREEPGLTVAALMGHDLSWAESQQEHFIPLVADALEDAAFFDDGLYTVRTGEREERVHEAIHPELRSAHHVGAVLTFPIRGESVRGRLFVLNPSCHDETALRFSDTIALLVECKLDAHAFCRTGGRDAAAAERTRVARDLHDGLLQSFTGIVLQLETVHATLGEDPDAARRMLTEVQAAMMADQRDLRAYVEQLQPRRRRGEMIFDFYARLDEMRRRFASQWGLRVTINADQLEPFVSQFLGQETFRIVQEAVTNSAKHGRAAHVDVNLRTSEGTLFIDVADDGVGLPLRGRLTLSDIRERGIGPAMLAERIASLNGDLVVDSGENGLRLGIIVPLGWSGA
jgi:signal transduction histidine kinase